MGSKYKYSDIDVTNQRFGRLVAVSKVGAASWRCKCDCGNEIVVPYSNLKSGVQKSCGCWWAENKESFGKSAKKHGGSGTVLYNRYCAIIQRCYNPNHYEYHRYGGRGIKMCDEWRNSFEMFREWAYANGYDEDSSLTMDRIDNNKGYSPDNCRFVTRKEQSLNRERSVVCEYNGVKYTSWDFANKFGMGTSFVYKRVKAGIPADAILEEWGKTLQLPPYLITVKEAALKYGKTEGHIKRMLRDGKLKGERINWKWYVNKEQD